MNTPRLQDRLGQRPKLLQCINAQTFKELGAGNVARTTGSCTLPVFQLLHCVIQAEANEVIRFPVESGVFLTNQADDFGEVRVLLHFVEPS